MPAYDVIFTTDHIELIDADDNTVTLPHCPATEAMAREDYTGQHQERDAAHHFHQHGYTLTGLYSEFPGAISN